MSVFLGTMGVFAAAVAVALFLSKRWRLSTIPALFAVGLLLGRPGVGVLADEPILAAASELGLLLMLFYTGLFANPRALKEGGGVGLPLAGYHLALNFAGAWWIGTFLDWPTRDKLFLAGILAASSTAVVLKILGDENRITRREGNVLVSLLLIEDWIFLGLYAFLAFNYVGGGLPTGGWQPLWIVGFAAYLLTCRGLRQSVWGVAQREVQIGLLTALGIFGALIGAKAGLPAVGAAFTTGLLLSRPRVDATLAQRDPAALREAAAAVFFVSYGAALAPTLSWAMLPLLGLCVASIVLTDILVLPILARRLGLRRSESFLTGSMLVARGGKSAAFAKLHPAATASSGLFPLAGLLAVVLTPLTPLLVRMGLGFAHRPTRLAFQSPGESFSRSARALLIPDALVRRTPGSARAGWATAAWTLAAVASVTAVLVSAGPWRLAGVALSVAALAGLYRRLAVRSRAALGPETPLRQAWGDWSGPYLVQGLPLLVSGPLALILLLVLLSPWSLVAYPVVVALVFLAALLAPWVPRPGGRRAPSLGRALSTR